MNGSKSRNWCFTLNNPRTEQFEWPANIKYAVWQKEIGELGTVHLQGYLELGTPRGIHYMRNVIPGAHFEIRRGTADDARDYCMKVESRIAGPWEYGEFVSKKQGRRNDLEAIKNMLDAGSSLMDIYEKHFESSARYYKFWDRYLQEKCPHRTQPPEVYILVGATGAGKSRFCHDSNPGAYWKSRGEWWDGYNGQSVVVIDEFYGWLPYDFVLRLTDRYPFDVPVKGGFRKFVATSIFFTSNRPPWEWWCKPRSQSAFSRRIKMITHFESSENKHSFETIEEYKTMALLMNYFNK